MMQPRVFQRHVSAPSAHALGGTLLSCSALSAGGLPLCCRRCLQAQLVNYDTVSDLAVLKIDSDTPLPTVKLGAWP